MARKTKYLSTTYIKNLLGDNPNNEDIDDIREELESVLREREHRVQELALEKELEQREDELESYND